MIFKTIWERTLLKDILKVFLLFLFSFYFLYTLIDYSLHMQDFIRDQKTQIADLLLYYIYQFIKRADLLIPLALLVATVKVLSSLNQHRELVAFQSCGIRLKTILRPFFVVAIFCSLFNYVSFQYFAPKSLTYLDNFYVSRLKSSDANDKKPFYTISLKDKTTLIYQSFDKEKQLFFDVLWIRSANDIWRIKYLSLDPQNRVGSYVDHLQRNAEGIVEKTESFETRVFKELSWNKNSAQRDLVPLENLSISSLVKMLHKKESLSPSEKSEISTQLYFKSCMPLLSLLVVFAVAPFCVRYSRMQPIFLIYAIALFGFIAFFTLMDAAVILGQNMAVTPAWAIFTPFALCMVGFAWKFTRTFPR